MQQHFHQVRREGEQDQELYKGSGNSSAVSPSFEHQRLILWTDTPPTALFLHVQMRTVCPHITLHSFFVPHLWVKVKLIVSFIKIVFIPLAQCLLPCTNHSALHPLLFPPFQYYKGCAHPEIPALIHKNPGVTDTLIQNLAQVMSPKGSSTTRFLMNSRILLALKTIRLPKSRVMSNPCPTISHCYLLLKNLLKALLHLKKQTSTTNKFVLCWLHRGTYRSQKQVGNDRKFVTL